jgi:hypothetical protein
MYFIQHCIICRASDSTVSEDTEIEPRTIATWQWQSDALTTTLDLIHIFYNCVTELQLCIHFRTWALCLIFTKGQNCCTLLYTESRGHKNRVRWKRSARGFCSIKNTWATQACVHLQAGMCKCGESANSLLFSEMHEIHGKHTVMQRWGILESSQKCFFLCKLW